MGPQSKKAASLNQLKINQNSLIERKSLKTLQSTATDKENLTGRPSNKTVIKKRDVKSNNDQEKKNLTSTGIQAGINDKIKMDDLTNEAGPSENYWQLLAEKRKVALEETLTENKLLHEKIEELIKENELLKEMVEESKSLVEVLTEAINEQEESGIDLAEASTSSTADDTTTIEKDESLSNEETKKII